jgi:hypothetical protein
MHASSVALIIRMSLDATDDGDGYQQPGNELKWQRRRNRAERVLSLTPEGRQNRPAQRGDACGVRLVKREPPGLAPPAVIGLVWRELEAQPGHRPSLADLSRVTAYSVRPLRRAWNRSGYPSLRHVITYGCVSWAWLLISQGVKPTAASRLAGFRSHWNFNRQSRRWGGRSSRDVGTVGPHQLPIDEIRAALRQFDDSPGPGHDIRSPRR